MADTIEGLSAELDQQIRTTAKLFDLLLKIKGSGIDDGGRLGPIIDEAKVGKEILDDCAKMLAEKRLSKPAKD